MPDIPNRSALEAELARKLARLFSSFSGHLLEVLEDVGYNVNNIPESVWATLTQQEKAVLLPFLERVALASAEVLLETIPISVADWALVNEAAANWARSYSTFLVGQIDRTSRRAIAASIRNSIAAYFEEGLTMGELVSRLEADPKLKQLFTKDIRDKLGRIFGPTRAELISVTEVTRAAYEGELGVVESIMRDGIPMIATWNTNYDDLVCPICRPLNGRKADGYTSTRRPYWIHPETGMRYEIPAHPRGRCWANWEIAP